MGQFAGSPLSFLPTANSHFWLLYLELIPHLLVLTVSFCPSCFCDWQFSHIKVKVKWTRYRPCVAQWVGRGIALLFRDRYTRRGWVVSSTPRPHFTPVKNRYPFYRRLGGPQDRSGRAENLVPTGIRSRTFRPVVNRYTDWATRPKDFLYNRHISFLPSHFSIHLNHNGIWKMEAVCPFKPSSGSRRRISKDAIQTHVIKEVFPSLWK